MDRDDILEQLREIRVTTTKIQSIVTDLMNAVASLPIPDKKPKRLCPFCGIEKTTAMILAWHISDVHDKDEEAIFSVIPDLPADWRGDGE
jgi:hypothetical protein